MMSEVSKGELKIFLFHFFVHFRYEMRPLLLLCGLLYA